MAGRQVTVQRAVTVYNGRNTDYDPRFTLYRGDTFPYIETVDGWLRVHSGGRTGWVDGSACLVSDPDEAPAPRYTLAPGRWAVDFGSISLNLQFEGNLAYLELVGPLPGDLLADPGPEGRSIVLTGTGLAPGSGWLDVSSRHCLRLEVQPDSTRLLCDRSTSWQILEHTEQLLRIEVAALAVAVAAEQRREREVLHLAVDGYVLPGAQAVSKGLLLSLPGVSAVTAFPPDFRTARCSARILADSGDLLLSLTSRTAYPWLLRQDGNDVMVEVLDKGPAGKLIVLDPGHDGSFDTGAVGAAGTVEAAVNYDIATRLAEMLRQDGARVLFTHERGKTCAPREVLDRDPYDRLERELQCRVDAANHGGADLFLSIHNNANGDRRVSGTQTYYTVANRNADRSAALAALVQSELVRALDSRNWGVLKEQFFVTKYVHCPAVLAEVLFLSNADDEAALGDPEVLDAAATALRRAIRRFYGVKAAAATAPDRN